MQAALQTQTDVPDAAAGGVRPRRRARRNASTTSRSTCPAVRPRMDTRATRTMSAGGNSPRQRRKASRSRRRARFRSTARPTCRLVTTPSRTSGVLASPQLSTTQPTALRRPSRFNRAKSREDRNLRAQPNRSSTCGVPAMDPARARLNRRQSLPTDPAPVPKDPAPALGRAARPKPVLAHPPDFRWLILPLHTFLSGPTSGAEPGTLPVGGAESTARRKDPTSRRKSVHESTRRAFPSRRSRVLFRDDCHRSAQNFHSSANRG